MNPYGLGLYGVFTKQSFLSNEHLLLHKKSISIQILFEQNINVRFETEG